MFWYHADLSSFCNVISPSVLEPMVYPAADVQMLADHFKPEAQRMAALSRIADVAVQSGRLSLTTALPLYATRSHTDLLRVLAGHAADLRDGAFVGTNGAKSLCLVGARGIGKTNFMRAFMAVSSAAYPSVISLFVSGEDLEDSTSSFARCSLRDLVFAAAANHGVVASTWEQLVRGLVHSKRQMLIVLDEVDQLYRVARDETVLRSNVRATLGALSYLGSTQCGALGTLLCGSAAATPMLIAARGSHLYGDAFPLLRDGVPDLNDTRYTRHLIEAADCTDIEQVEHILSFTRVGSSVHEDDRRKLSHIVAFVAGSVPRTIANTLASRQRVSNESALSGGLLARLFALPRGLSVDAQVLYRCVFQLLWKKNKALVKRCFADDGRLSVCVIESGAWAQALQPITRAELARAWQKLASTPKSPFAADAAYLQRLLDDLSDANLIAQRQIQSAETVWPMSMAQLALMTRGDAVSFLLFPPSIWEVLQRAANIATIGDFIK